MTKERRREPRVDASSLNLLAYDNLSGRLLGSLVNLSRGGLMILGSNTSEPGGTLQIDLRRGDSPETPLLSMAIRISWVSPANTDGSHWFGASTIGISPEDEKRLSRLLESARKELATRS